MVRLLRGVVVSMVLAASIAVFGVRPALADDLSTSYSTVNGGSTSQGIIFAGICTSSTAACDCRDNGNCSLDDVLQVFANIAIFILGISGSAVLFAFVYGGFCWLFSRGDSKWVERGKDTMTGATIGLAIIFGSYVALNFIVSGLTTAPGATPATGTLENTVNQGLTSSDKENAAEGVFTTE